MAIQRCLCLLLLLTWSLCCPAQTPPARYLPLSDSSLRVMHHMDAALEEADGARIAPFLQNTDRAHLQLTFSTGPTIRITLAIRDDQDSNRTLAAISDMAHALNGRLLSRNWTRQEGSFVASGVVALPIPPRRGPLETTIAWPDLLAVLWKAHTDKVEIRMRVINGSLLQDAPCGIQWTRASVGTRPVLAAVVTPTVTVSAMRLRFGTDPARLRRARLLIPLFLLAPFVIILLARQKALGQVGNAAAYQAYNQTKRLVMIGSFFAWTFGFTQFGMMDLFSPLLSPLPSSARLGLMALVLFGVPLVTLVGISVLSYPVDRQFRDIQHNRRVYLMRAVLPLVFILLPALLLILGYIVNPKVTDRLVMGADGRGGSLEFPILVGIVTGLVVMVMVRLAVIRAVQPGPLASGELLERILALARRAEVNVSQVLIARTERDRVANALVTQNGTVVLTNYLLRHFTKAEVDAVVAHELGHLRLRHIPKRVTAHTVGIVLWLALVVSCNRFVPNGWPREALYLSVFLVPTLVQHFISRRHELEADAEAVTLTGDVNTYLRMLQKLAALNMMALRPGRLHEATSTHPGTARRIQALARKYHLDPTQTQMWMQDAVLDLRSANASTVTEDRYPLPTPGDKAGAPERVFTMQQRSRVSGPLYLLGMVPGFAVMLLAFPLLHALAPSGTGWLAAVIALGGIALGFFVIALGLRHAGFVAMRRLRAPVQKKVEATYHRALDTLPHVGMSPGAELRSYGGETSWDAGFLLLEPGRLRFFGDACAFTLRPDQIVQAEIRTHSYPFMGTFERLYVTWRVTPDAPPQEFSLEARDSRSFRDLYRRTRQLQAAIEAWRAQMPFSVLASEENAGLPPTPEQVLSAPCTAATKVSMLPLAAALLTAVAIVAVGTFAAARLGGKGVVESPLLRYGMILVALRLVKVLVPWYCRCLPQRAPAAQEGRPV